ncbi:MAG: biotin carboxylase N-terminal domain-containing protein [Planctomycetota bacterium]
MSPPPFRRVLVANRGEIAVRIARGLRELGIEPVGICSDPDRTATHTLAFPRMIAIGGQTALESYLDIDKVIDAAKRASADAIHPGYGFLSENPAFARAVRDAGLTFIGPTPEAMEILGSKGTAKDAAVAAGVPVVPGSNRDQGDDAMLAREADAVGFPLLIKAVAGGGGKGMRSVRSKEDFAGALATARREAKAAFGDDRVLLERFVHPARHVEIQVIADDHGDVVSLHERECSVQRRHQKVIEEAPSPVVDASLRQRMGEAATALARRVGYRNAGTVEFLVDDNLDFYFLEVNTRLQVEHPVTELVTGVDLVHLQVHCAAGGRLRDLLGGRDLEPRGHAIEVRIYAEAPANGYLPAAGRLQLVREASGPGVRVDSGVRTGDEVTVFYDPMLAKLIVHAPTRAEACARMAQALRDSVYLGIETNVDFLRRVVDDEGFRAGDLRIDFLDRKPELAAGPADAPPDLALVAALLAPLGVAAAPGAGGSRPASTTALWQSVEGLRLWEAAR